MSMRVMIRHITLFQNSLFKLYFNYGDSLQIFVQKQIEISILLETSRCLYRTINYMYFADLQFIPYSI